MKGTRTNHLPKKIELQIYLKKKIKQETKPPNFRMQFILHHHVKLLGHARGVYRVGDGL